MSESVKFDRAAQFYDETRGFPTGEDANIAAFIAKSAGFTAQDKVLEIGVGTGRIALPLSAHTGAYVGLDLSVPMMQRLHEKQNGAQSVHLIEGDAMRLPLVSGGFDAAVIVHVFHLVSDPAAAANELARVLRPGGKAIHCWNRSVALFEPLQKVWDEAIVSVNQTQREQKRQILDEQGWRAIAHDQVSYTISQPPTRLVDLFRRRVWSVLWELPDEVWQKGVRALEQALHEHYPDPDAPITSEGEFHLTVYER